jgi:hypothetical protein
MLSPLVFLTYPVPKIVMLPVFMLLAADRCLKTDVCSATRQC